MVQKNKSFNKRNISNNNTDVIFPLCSGLPRPHLEHAVQFWSSHHEKDIAKLEDMQHRATKMISLRTKPYNEKLSSFKTLSLEKHCLRGKLIECGRGTKQRWEIVEGEGIRKEGSKRRGKMRKRLRKEEKTV